MHIDPPQSAAFPVTLRIPAWADAARVQVNDVPYHGRATSGTYVRIEREWHVGDAIVLDMPMPWRWVRGRKKQAGRAALLRGPVLFCLNPDRNPAVARHGLRDITLDPSSPSGPEADTAIRPDGLCVRVRAWSPGRTIEESPDLELVFSEFADPQGEATYFRLSDDTLCTDDDLWRCS